jgi:putative effector of murein hydrolase
MPLEFLRKFPENFLSEVFSNISVVAYTVANLLNKHEKGFSTKPVLQSIIIVQQNSSLCRICLKIPWMGFVKQFREKTLNLI